MGEFLYLDTILVPLSLFTTIGYHAFLWHSFKNKPSLTSVGVNMLRRRRWLQGLQEGDNKKGMLAVQSLRNTLMPTILTASITMIITLSLAALFNNTYNANHTFNTSTFFRLQSGKTTILKYGSASIFFLFSLLCSSMALASLIDANFLINATLDTTTEFSSSSSLSLGYTLRTLERGFLLAVVGNRVLCITFPLKLWMLGPMPVALFCSISMETI